MEKKVDRRVLKSKKAIREAFLGLLEEKKLKEITIKDISERAQVDRKTFYNYYPSIYALLNEFENELVMGLDALFDEIDFSRFKNNPEEIFESLSRFLKPNLDYYKIMFKINFSENLSNKIIGLLKFKIVSAFEKDLIALNMDPLKYDLQMVSEYLSTAILGVYYEWIMEGSVTSFDIITQEIKDITLYGLYGCLVQKTNLEKIGE